MAALMMAASEEKIETMKILMESNYGATAITNAIFFNHAEASKALLTSKTEVGHTANENGLLISAGLGNNEIIQISLDYGVNSNARGKKGRTSFMAAAEFERVATVNLLLEKGADPSARDSENNTVLMLAEDEGNSSITELIRKADKN